MGEVCLWQQVGHVTCLTTEQDAGASPAMLSMCQACRQCEPEERYGESEKQQAVTALAVLQVQKRGALPGIKVLNAGGQRKPRAL